MESIAKLPFSETFEKNTEGDMYVMKEKYAIPYRKSVEEQTKLWVEGNPVHNTFANECCPDFSCCCPQNLWPENQRKAFAASSDEIRQSMMLGALAGIVPKDTYVSGQTNPEETKH